MAAHIHGESRLPHSGACRDDNQLSGLEAVRQPVQVDESGGGAARCPGAVLDLLHRQANQVLDRLVVLRGAFFRNPVQFGVGGVDQVVGVAGIDGVTQLGDAGAGLDQAAQSGLVSHNL